MPHNLGPKKIKPKHRDIHIRTRGDLMTILWRDKQDILMLMNIHNAQHTVTSAMWEGKP
jgi:hypothetical protein